MLTAKITAIWMLREKNYIGYNTMGRETKKVTDPDSCQDFQSGLRVQVEMRGYLTPRVGQVLQYLSKNCPLFTGQTTTTIGQQAVTLTQDRETPLQSLYVVANLLRGFDFSSEIRETIGYNTTSLLSDTYNQNLSLAEHNVDMRMAGWAVLEAISTNASEPLKKNILDLATQVGRIDQEDDLVQSRALRLALALSTPQE